MSSTYRWICLSHDPAIIINHPEYQNFDEITGAILNKTKVEDHEKCDLIVGRWSGGLVELVCPGCEYHGSSYQNWVDKDWLLLMSRAFIAGVDVPNNLFNCWYVTRLQKLAILIK